MRTTIKISNPIRMQSHLNRGYDQLEYQLDLLKSNVNPTKDQLDWFKLGFDMAWSKSIISLESHQNVVVDDFHESD